MVDADEQKPAGGAEAQRFIDRIFQDLAQAVAVQFAGQAIMAGEKGELALMLIALIDDAQHALRPRRTSVGAGKPAAGVLDP